MSLTFKTVLQRGGLRAAQPYNAHLPWNCIWQLTSSLEYGLQPVHTSYPRSTDSLLFPFPTQDSAPSLQRSQHVHPSQENQKGLWHELSPCLMPSPRRQLAGRSQPQPFALGALPRSHFLWSPGLFLQESLPHECISSRLFKSLAFSLPKWPTVCWFTSQSPTWDLSSHTLLSLTVYLANFMIMTLSRLITALSTLSLLAAQMTGASYAGEYLTK